MLRKYSSSDSIPLSNRSSIDTDAGSIDLILPKHNNDSSLTVDTYDNRFYNLDQRLDVDHNGFDQYPEGGRGWLILFSCTTINFFYLGQVYSWGVYQSELEKQGLAPTWKLAFVSGVSTCLMALVSIPGMFAVKKFSHKTVASIGSVLLGVGQIISSWTIKSLVGLYITQGFVVGCGLAFCLISVTGLPATWFYKKRALACGINSAGGGIGGSVLSIISQTLIKKVGMEWSLRIVGIISLVFTIPAALSLTVGVPEPKRPSLFKDLLYGLKNKHFIVLLLAQICASWPFFSAPLFIPVYARSIGLSDAQGASFSVGYNLASAAGRIGLGALADLVVGNYNSLILSYIMAGLGALVVWPFATNIGTLSIVVALIGAGCGGVFSLQVPCIGQAIESFRIEAGICLYELGSSPGYLLGSFVSGLLLESFGGPNSSDGFLAYRPGEYYIGGTTLSAAILVLGLRFYSKPRIFSKI